MIDMSAAWQIQASFNMAMLKQQKEGKQLECDELSTGKVVAFILDILYSCSMMFANVFSMFRS